VGGYRRNAWVVIAEIRIPTGMTLTFFGKRISISLKLRPKNCHQLVLQVENQLFSETAFLI